MYSSKNIAKIVLLQFERRRVDVNSSKVFTPFKQSSISTLTLWSVKQSFKRIIKSETVAKYLLFLGYRCQYVSLFLVNEQLLGLSIGFYRIRFRASLFIKCNFYYCFTILPLYLKMASVIVFAFITYALTIKSYIYFVYLYRMVTILMIVSFNNRIAIKKIRLIKKDWNEQNWIFNQSNLLTTKLLETLISWKFFSLFRLGFT